MHPRRRPRVALCRPCGEWCRWPLVLVPVLPCPPGITFASTGATSVTLVVVLTGQTEEETGTETATETETETQAETWNFGRECPALTDAGQQSSGVSPSPRVLCCWLLGCGGG